MLIIYYSVLNVFKDKEWTPRPHKERLAHCDDRLPIYIGLIYEIAHVAAQSIPQYVPVRCVFGAYYRGKDD